MPIYEYKCDDCEKVTEKFFRRSEPEDPIPCDHCNSKKTRKIISSTNVKYGCNGFYSTDV